MLLELYIAILIMSLITFGIAFFNKSVWMWAFTLVLSGILIFASYDIVQNVAVVANQTQVGGVVHYDYSIETSHTADLTFSYLAIGLFLLSLTLFISDLYLDFKEGNLGERKL